MNYNQQVDESFCHLDEKPSSEQECAAAPCHSVYQFWPNNQPYFPYEPRSHPGHSSWNVPSADHQWRTGPWGSVCFLLFLIYFHTYLAAVCLQIIPLFKAQALLPLRFDEPSIWDNLPHHSARVRVRGASRGEWSCVRTQRAAALITVTRESNLVSQRAVTRDLVLCGITASGER